MAKRPEPQPGLPSSPSQGPASSRVHGPCILRRAGRQESGEAGAEETADLAQPAQLSSAQGRAGRNRSSARARPDSEGPGFAGSSHRSRGLCGRLWTPGEQSSPSSCAKNDRSELWRATARDQTHSFPTPGVLSSPAECRQTTGRANLNIPWKQGETTPPGCWGLWGRTGPGMGAWGQPHKQGPGTPCVPHGQAACFWGEPFPCLGSKEVP